MKLSNNRVEYIDAAKGIGIILVIFGHLLSLDSPLSSIIYSFHMPFFFWYLAFLLMQEESFFRIYLSKLRDY